MFVDSRRILLHANVVDLEAERTPGPIEPIPMPRTRLKSAAPRFAISSRTSCHSAPASKSTMRGMVSIWSRRTPAPCSARRRRESGRSASSCPNSPSGPAWECLPERTSCRQTGTGARCRLRRSLRGRLCCPRRRRRPPVGRTSSSSLSVVCGGAPAGAVGAAADPWSKSAITATAGAATPAGPSETGVSAAAEAASVAAVASSLLAGLPPNTPENISATTIAPAPVTSVSVRRGRAPNNR